MQMHPHTHTHAQRSAAKPTREQTCAWMLYGIIMGVHGGELAVCTVYILYTVPYTASTGSQSIAEHGAPQNAATRIPK